MRKQYKFIKHSKTDSYKAFKPADIEPDYTRCVCYDIVLFVIDSFVV